MRAIKLEFQPMTKAGRLTADVMSRFLPSVCSDARNDFPGNTAIFQGRKLGCSPLPIVRLILDAEQQPHEEEQTGDICWQSSIGDIHVGRDRSNCISQHCRATQMTV